MTENKPKIDWKQLEIGGMWKKEEGNETKFSAKLKLRNQSFGIVVLPNRDRKGNEPEYRVYLSPISFKEMFGKDAPTVNNTRSIVQDVPMDEKEKITI